MTHHDILDAYCNYEYAESNWRLVQKYGNVEVRSLYVDRWSLIVFSDDVDTGVNYTIMVISPIGEVTYAEVEETFGNETLEWARTFPELAK